MRDENVKAVVLYIEDDADLAEIFRYKFEADGFQFFTAVNGHDGLIIAEEEQPDVILLDILMEEVDGFEVLKDLKAGLLTKKIPVIILTNLEDRATKEEMRKLGATDFLIKAKVVPEQVIKKIEEILKM